MEEIDDSNSASSRNTISISDENSTFLQSINSDSNKKRKSTLYGGPAAKTKHLIDSDDEDDGVVCTICLETCTTSGAHRLVSLKCGHIFGSKCIERWLQSQPFEKKSCPTCNKKANVSDLRIIYAQRLICVDDTESTKLYKAIEPLVKENIQLYKELLIAKEGKRDTQQQMIKKHWTFPLEKTIEICQDGDCACRVMAYNSWTKELFISNKSAGFLAGYGVVKASLVDYTLGQYKNFHTNEIKDLAYSQLQNLLLTASLDKTANIINQDMTSVAKIKTGKHIWSCTWDHYRPEHFYLGCAGGAVCQYDLRNTTEVLQVLSTPVILPVTSVQSTLNGLVASLLSSCYIWTPSIGGQWKRHRLSVEGPFSSLSYDRKSDCLLVSSRSTVKNERSKLIVAKVHCNTRNINCELEQIFYGSLTSSLPTRSTWVRASGAEWVAAYSESDSMLCLNGLNGVKTFSSVVTDPVLDLFSVELNGKSILASLSRSKLRLYEAIAVK